MAVPKVTNANNLKEYTPISLLCVLAKALENIVVEQVKEYIEVAKIFDKNQSGFRKNHSTHTALLKVTQDVRSAVNNSCFTVLTMLDFS